MEQSNWKKSEVVSNGWERRASNIRRRFVVERHRASARECFRSFRQSHRSSGTFFFFFEFSPCLVPENSVRNRKLSSKFKTYLYFFTLIYTHIGFLASLLIINWDLNLSCFLVRRKRNLPFHFLFSSSSSSSFFKIYLHFSYIGFFCFLGTLYFFSFRYCMKCIYIGYKCLWGFKLHIVD